MTDWLSTIQANEKPSTKTGTTTPANDWLSSTSGGKSTYQPNKLVSDIAPVTQPQPQNKGLFEQIGGFISDKLNSITPGGTKAGIERVKATPLKEFFLPTATGAEAFKGYIKGTASSALNAVKGLGKLTPAYMAYRAVEGKPVTPKEYAKNLVSAPLEALNTAWRVQPVAPLVGAGLNSWKAVRQYLQGKITAQELIKAPMEGITKQPGFGEVFTDNVKIAEALDIVFMATMVASPLIKKKIGDLNLKAEELNQVSKTLGVKPNDPLSKINEAWKKEIKKLPDTFTENPKPANMARRVELNQAYTTLKDAGVIEKQYASAYDFLTGKFGKPEGVGIKTPVEPGQITAKVFEEKPKSGEAVKVGAVRPPERVAGAITPKEGQAGSVFKEAGTLIPESQLNLSGFQEIDQVVAGKKPAWASDYETEAIAKKEIEYAKEKGLLIGYDKYNRVYAAKTPEALKRVVNSGSAGAGVGEKLNPAIEREHGLALGYKDTQATQGLGEGGMGRVTTEKPLTLPEIKPKTVSVPRSQIPVGEGKIKVSRLEARVTKSLEKTPQEIIDKLGPTFQEMNKKENIAKASEYVVNNPDEALRVLTGDIEPPKGVLRNSIYVAMQNQAIGDVNLARRLASIGSTRMGQEIGILSEIDPNSPVKLMEDIIKIREKAFQSRYRGKSVKEITGKTIKEIKSKVKVPDRWDWNRFLDSIKC